MAHFKLDELDVGGVLKRAPEILLYIAVFLWLTVCVTDTSMVGKWMSEGPITDAFVIHRVPLLVGAAEIIRIWRGEYGKRDAVGLAICIVMGYGAWLLDWNNYLCAIAIIFCARNVNIRRLCAISVAYVSLLAAVIVILSLFSILPDYVLEQERGGRHCLGFTYCLYPGQYLFTLTLVVCWLRGKRLSVWEAVVLAGANAWVYVMTISRLSFGLSLLAIAFTLLYKYDAGNRLPWARISSALRWAFPVMVALTIILTAAYLILGPDNFPAIIGKIVGARIYHQAEGVRNFGIPLLSQDILYVGAGFGVDGPSDGPIIGYNFVDNLFLHAGFRNGMVFSTGLMALYTITACDAHKNGDVTLVAMLAILAAHCSLDNLALWIHYNVLVFTIASIGKENSVIWFRRGAS